MCVCISWAEADDKTRKTLGGSYIFVGRKDPISLKTKRRLGHGAPMVRDLNSALCLCQMQFDGLLLFKGFLEVIAFWQDRRRYRSQNKLFIYGFFFDR